MILETWNACPSIIMIVYGRPMQDVAKTCNFRVFLQIGFSLSSVVLTIHVNGVDLDMITLDIGVHVQRIPYNNNLGVFL